MRNGQGFEIAEDVSYAGVHMQNWVLACFGYQYLFHGCLAVVLRLLLISGACGHRCYV